MRAETDPLAELRHRLSPLLDLLRRPFQVMNTTSHDLSVAEQLQYRRQALLQLILVILGALLTLFFIVFVCALLLHRVALAPPPRPPAGTFAPPPGQPGPPPGQAGPPPGQSGPPPGQAGPPPPQSPVIPLEPLVFLGIWLLLTVVAFVLNKRSHTVLASLVYIYGLVVLTGIGLLLFSAIQSQQSAIVFSFVSLIFIVLTGLLLPTVHVWLTCLLNMLFLVVASLLNPYNASPLLTTPFFIAIFLIIAVLTWIFARVAGANVQSIILTLEREHELAALQQQFIISANHEMRTPIMAMYGSLELLQTFGPRIEDATRLRILERGMRAGHIVHEMLDALMEVTVTEATQVQLAMQPIDIRQQVLADIEVFDPGKTSASHTLVALAREHHIAIDIPATLTVLADKQKLRQILLNLLTNAVKYSAAGTNIVIAARVSARNSGFVTISIRDYGLGVPADQVKYLFQRFSRLKRDIGGPARGTGLGLYLTRMFVEAMGGQIWVTSTGIPGEGSTFHFTLALSNAPDLPTTKPRKDMPATTAGAATPVAASQGQ